MPSLFTYICKAVKRWALDREYNAVAAELASAQGYLVYLEDAYADYHNPDLVSDIVIERSRIEALLDELVGIEAAQRTLARGDT